MATLVPAGVIFVDNVSYVAAFYQAVADMTILHADDQHIVLSTPGFQLTIHALHPSGSTPGPYPIRHDTYIKLCFPVADLATARALAATHGGHLLPADNEWQARGFLACDGHDPEGNVFQLRQNAP